MELTRDVEYGKGGGRPLKMHILRPKTLPENPMPVVVWIHGGGWRGGNKDSGISLLIPFAERGYFFDKHLKDISEEGNPSNGKD